MKRKILIAVALIVAVVALLPAAFSVWRMKMLLPEGEVTLAGHEGGMVCSSDAYNAFVPLMSQAGEMGLSQMPFEGTAAEQRAILDRYAALGLTGPETVVTSVNLDDGKVYANTCAAERCTMAEMAAAEAMCWQDTRNCTYLAIRFRGQDHCVLAPAKDAP
ncbi:hypothetical protein JMM61_20740 [Rhodovulum sulfidophilum]|uniref:hypothetical protein n=1 Tax=Rhodovulum sulfidophilum TaxID=35806 RepID=UPI00192596F4|nr:hypothetical protein [Rhodovulum sulfidophilum]MBL3587740.1 hypothetical protein [Rhodovulum sulfidophilum]